MEAIYGIASGLPDYSKGIDANAPCPEVGWPNMVFTADVRSVRSPYHAGPLSVKATYGGSEVYETREARHIVDGSNFLVLNEGTAYDHEVSLLPDQSTHSVCVFFQTGYPEHLIRDCTDTEENLLTTPDGQERLPYFIETLHRHDRTVTPVLEQLHQAAAANRRVDRVWLAERFHKLFRSLLAINGVAVRELDRISAARLPTRVERLRRLRIARDFMESNYMNSLTLEQIAEAAALSPHHFLRAFTEAFGTTPHQYLVERRLKKAQELLRETELPVSAICYDVGFGSPSSFSSLFRRRTGYSPVEFRRAS